MGGDLYILNGGILYINQAQQKEKKPTNRSFSFRLGRFL